MTWRMIRPATDKDMDALNKAARRFADRHGYTRDVLPGNSWYTAVDTSIEMNLEMHKDPNDWEYSVAKHLSMLWKRCVRRALNSPEADGVSYGYVGANIQ